jgi:hypothetical protein
MESTRFQQQTHGLPFISGISSLENGEISDPNSNDEDYDFPSIEEILASSMPIQLQSRPLVIDLTGDSEDDEVSIVYTIGLPLFTLMTFAYSLCPFLPPPALLPLHCLVSVRRNGPPLLVHLPRAVSRRKPGSACLHFRFTLRPSYRPTPQRTDAPSRPPITTTFWHPTRRR